jgi:multiple antibiotic resistance protein
MELFIAVLAKLFSVVNPLGAVPLFLALTTNYNRQERRKTILYTSIYFTLILLAFFFGGSYILGFFGLNINALRIAGGLVILNSGFSLLNDQFAQNRGLNDEIQEEAMTKSDISFSPLAMPMLSGPGSISLLIALFSEHNDWPSRWIITAVIFVTGIIVFAILIAAPYLRRVLGVAGLKAGARIMGFIVMAIGVQSIILGVEALVKL